jgi:phosphoglycerate dehydrogenase-like enzyme
VEYDRSQPGDRVENSLGDRWLLRPGSSAGSVLQVRVLCQLGDEIAARVQRAVPGVDVVVIPTEDDLPADVEGDVLITLAWGSTNLAQVLERGVRWVHTVGTGVDAFPLHVLNGQTLTCSRGASAVPISEWVLAVMLAFEKHLPDSWVHSADARWHYAELGGLAGKTLGIVGFGGIGQAVARRALAFDMKIRALRRTKTPSPVLGVEITAWLPDLLRSADHVVVAAPSTVETRHLIDADAFAAMKPGVHLVNIARGALVDQEALRIALDEGTVARASLDAVEPEPLPKGHWMYSHPKVRLSPHISWSMPGAFDVLLDTFVDNLRRYQAGETLTGVVDVTAGY